MLPIPLVRSTVVTVRVAKEARKLWNTCNIPILQPPSSSLRPYRTFARTSTTTIWVDTTATTTTTARITENVSILHYKSSSQQHQQQRYVSSGDNDDDDKDNERKDGGINPIKSKSTSASGDSSSNKPKATKKPRSSSMEDMSRFGEEPDSPRFVAPEDPFGLLFDDGSDKLGPILPPIYERDSITGRLIADENNNNNNNAINPDATTNRTVTLKQQQQLTDQEKEILAMDSMERNMKLLDSIKKHWQESSTPDGTGVDSSDTTTAETATTTTLMEMGERIRTTDMATNVLGRSVHGQRTKEVLEDGTEIISRDTEHNFSQPLTIEEYHAFEQYMKTKHDINITVDDIPVSTQQKPNPIAAPEQQQRPGRTGLPKKDEAPTPVHPDEAELSLKWLTSRAQRQMDDTLDDNPYSDLMPGDLSPNRVVNRKHAKIIPTKLLHYNHMSLLQHFIGPTGQIMNRSQTRLGARDQRRISKLIKRSRALGLIPYVGQFKIENHGWQYTKDIHTNRKWENQIEQRGLVIQSSLSSSLSSQKLQQYRQQQLSSGNLSTETTSSPTPPPSSTTTLGALPDDF